MVERLTYSSKKGWEIKGADGTPCDEVCENRLLSGCHDCPIQKAFDRLAAYEDAMPFERAQELAQAEKDGRLVVLPVKEGTTIYRVRLNFDGDHYEIIEKDFDLARFRPEDFGRIVFTTREEAEAELKKREEADDETD